MDILKLIAVVKTVGATIIPGASAAIAAGEAVMDLVKSVRPTLASNDQAALDAALPDLLAKMNTDVDQAMKDLGAA